MVARPDSSRQGRAVLATLLDDPIRWRYGYDLSLQTGLASGTLYPILGRMADRELLETSWEADPPEGRPRRHLYRLTATGLRRAPELSVPPETATRDPEAPRPLHLLGGAS